MNKSCLLKLKPGDQFTYRNFDDSVSTHIFRGDVPVINTTNYIYVYLSGSWFLARRITKIIKKHKSI